MENRHQWAAMCSGSIAISRADSAIARLYIPAKIRLKTRRRRKVFRAVRDRLCDLKQGRQLDFNDLPTTQREDIKKTLRGGKEE